MTSPDKPNGPSLCVCVCLCGPDNGRMRDPEGLQVCVINWSFLLRQLSHWDWQRENRKWSPSLVPVLIWLSYSPPVNPYLYVSSLNSYRCWSNMVNLIGWFPVIRLWVVITFSLTRFEDLVADGEASAVSLVVRHKLDEELVPRGDQGRGSDLPTILPDQLPAVIHPIPHFHIVISAQRETNTQIWSSKLLTTVSVQFLSMNRLWIYSLTFIIL